MSDVDELYREADQLKDDGKLEESIAKLNEALAQDDSHVLTHLALAVVLGRVGEHRELADLAVYLISEGAGYINGEVVTIDGGEWLNGAGQFSIMERLSAEEWQAMRGRKGG